MAADALGALGLAYGDSDEEDSDEDDAAQPPAAIVPPTTVVPPAATAAAAAKNSSAASGASMSTLPDADSLLSGLPDEVDWSARAQDDDEPQYDAPGTKYNAMAPPQSMLNEADRFNAQSGSGKSGGWKAAGSAARSSVAAALSSVDSVGVGVGATGRAKAAASSSSAAAAAAPPAKPKARSSGVLLPPQLAGRRPNITTEDSAGMGVRTAKRPKQGPP